MILTDTEAELLKALELIRDWAEPCVCDHSDEDCCAKMNPIDFFCAACVADIAIKKAREEQ